jgi:hypothetical protein
MKLPRLLPLSAILVLPFLVAACGSSASTSVAPSPVARCEISLNSSTTTVPAGGGSGVATVAATRECAWSASVEGGSWLSIRSGASGQGEGTVEFTAAANPDPQTRTGALVVNGSKTPITQSAAECVITLATSSADFPQTGGTERINVVASSTLCAWTASTDASWISITSGTSGRGSGPVTISVAATTGPPRVGLVTIAGQNFSVTQSQGCGYAIDRTTFAATASGATGSVVVTTAPACPWAATPNADWISVTPASGAGPGLVSFSVAPTTGAQRTGTAVIAGQLFTITQAPGCAYNVSPTSHSAPASGGSAVVSVAAASGCPWSATTDVPWISLQGASSGSGPGAIAFTVAPTPGPARSGTLTIAGQQVTVTQSQGCGFTIAPQSASVPAAGGNGTVSVTAGSDCSWTATSSAPWITISSGASGTGNGSVQFTVAATTSGTRSATLTIAGQTFTVTQGGSCTIGVSTERVAMPAVGGAGSVSVTSDAACAWTATSSAPWLAIVSGATGSGNGAVGFTAAPNTGPARTATLAVGGRTVTVDQAGACAYTLAPGSQSVPAAGGTAKVDVTTSSLCAWTAVSTVPWIVVTSGAASVGTGAVEMTVAANPGAPRSGVVTVAGQSFTINQASGCSFTVSPESIAAPAAGTTARVDVSAAAGCAWTASSEASWITVTAGAAGSGVGQVDLAIAANSGSNARTGSVMIAGRTVSVSQEPGCVVTLSPTSQSLPASGGAGSLTVQVRGKCTWTAVSGVPWIVVTAGGSGEFDGVVQFTVAANSSGGPRSGTIVVSGAVFTVNQQ